MTHFSDENHPCDAVLDDGGEWVRCRRHDTRYEGRGWFCPEHKTITREWAR